MSRILAFFRKPANWPLVVIPILLMIWARVGAPALGEASFDSVAYYHTIYTQSPPPGPAGEPLTQHVLLIVVDGLRVDTSREMPTLNALRAQGADRVVTVGQPSFSLPGWTLIGTGAWQEQSGFATNFAEGAIQIDTIFAEAKRAGLSTAIVGSPAWGQLYATGVDTFRTQPDPPEIAPVQTFIDADSQIAAMARDVLRDQPGLMLLHFVGTDNAAHEYGGVSTEYQQTALAVDGYIADLLRDINLDDTTVIVTADHGHVDRGGHGGWEPVVLHVPLVTVGRGVIPGQYAEVPQVDLAPTVAVLLGTSIPTASQGDPLLDQIDAPAALKAARAVDVADEIAGRYQSMLDAIGSGRGVDRSFLEQARALLAAGDDAAAIQQAQHSDDNVRAQWADARLRRLNRERLLRLPIALLILLPFGLYAVWWSRARWDWIVPVAGGVLYILLWNVVYFPLRGLTYSISWFNQDADIVNFITARVMDALMILTVVMLVVGVLSRKESLLEIVRRAVNALVVITAAIALQALVFYVLWGVTFTWLLPDMRLGFKFYMDIFQTTAFWPVTFLPAGILLPLLAALAGWLAGLLPRKEAAPPPA